jgi:cytochrome c biogenesis protein CcmG/thiol:disulfide interchange protein DsbE
MRLNIIIAVLVGLMAYGLTLYMDTRTPKAPQITMVPSDVITTLNDAPAAKPFSFTDYEGRTHALEDFKGKIVILNFWASWCAPCIKEFPMLINTVEQRPDDVVLIALSSDMDEDSMNRFIKRKLALPEGAAKDSILIAFDENQTITQGLYGTTKLPETYLIDREQNMRAKIIGADWESEDLEEYLNLLLGSTENDS